MSISLSLSVYYIFIHTLAVHEYFWTLTEMESFGSRLYSMIREQVL